MERKSRSVNSESAGRSHMDFFSEHPGGQRNYQDQQEKSIPGGIDSGGISAVKQGFVVPRSQGERTGEGELDAMRVGELNLTTHNASTITESMNTLYMFIRHAGGGEVTSGPVA